MRSSILRAGLLVLGAAVAGCGGAGDAPVDNTTAELLSNPVGDGMSTPIAADPTMEPSGPPVQVARLGFNRGDSTALVKVLEMSDFGCGYCRKFHDESFPTLRDRFIDTGLVEWKFVPYITGMFRNSLVATEAGECVMAQSASDYDAIAGRLWEDQAEWKGSDEPAPIIREWVSELGVDMDDFDACLAEDARIERIASATTLARQLGVRGTPTFIILGYPPLQGALPLEAFSEILAAVHDEAVRKAGERGGSDPGDDTGR